MEKKKCQFCGGSGWVPESNINGYNPFDANIFNYQGGWKRCRCNPEQPGIDKKELVQRLRQAEELVGKYPGDHCLDDLTELLVPIAPYCRKLLERDYNCEKHLRLLAEMNISEQPKYLAGVMARMLAASIVSPRDVAFACSTCLGGQRG